MTPQRELEPPCWCRCALALWFSHDPDYWEPELGLARDLVTSSSSSGSHYLQVGVLRAGETPSSTLREALEDLTMFSEEQAR